MIVAVRKARDMIAKELDHEGRYDDARLCRAGMRDNAATRVLARHLHRMDQRLKDVSKQHLSAGLLAGTAIGFMVAIVLLA